MGPCCGARTGAQPAEARLPIPWGPCPQRKGRAPLPGGGLGEPAYPAKGPALLGPGPWIGDQGVSPGLDLDLNLDLAGSA